MEYTPGCDPPEYKKQRGRPPTKRIRKGAYRRKETKCGNCGGTKHNACTCRNALKNTQRERAQDRHQRAQDQDLDSDSDSGSDSDDLESDTRSLNSEILQERQFQAEMDRYNFVIARAHNIIKRRRQEELEDNDMLADEDSDSDADSELSVLASSLFNGMEGVEFSSIDSDNLGVAFSPRKTRSGKVVGYRDEK
jgi:hypothetical protein